MSTMRFADITDILRRSAPALLTPQPSTLLLMRFAELTDILQRSAPALLTPQPSALSPALKIEVNLPGAPGEFRSTQAKRRRSNRPGISQAKGTDAHSDRRKGRRWTSGK